MVERPAKTGTMRRLAGSMLARYIRFVRATSRVTFEPADAPDQLRTTSPSIVVFWHGQFLMIPGMRTADSPVTEIMVARHGDGDIIGQALQDFGMQLIRGAGAGERKRDRGGSAALRGALRALERGHDVAMTADVPPGPARKAGPGVVMLARMSGRPIRVLAVATSRFWAFDTWSRMTLNLPFSRIAVVLGEPIAIGRDATPDEVERCRMRVETELDGVTRRAYQIVGGGYERATPASAIPPGDPPLPQGFRLRTYRLLTRLASPLVPLLLRHRARRGKEDVARLEERLGRPSLPRPDRRLIWFHAASVGETMAVLPVIEAIRRLRPDTTALLTTGTVTSAQLAARRVPEGTIHQYVPVDTPRAMAQFLDYWRPSLVVLTESEIWPNMLVACAERSVAVALINARMSSRSFQRWRRQRPLARQLFSRVAVTLAQNQALARRFRTLGARDVRPIGNLKIDAPAPPVTDSVVQEVQRGLAGRQVLLAASTHPGEDAIVIEAIGIMRRTMPHLVGIIVPRHPHRGAEVVDLARAAGFATAQRSRNEPIAADTDIYVADTIGELGSFYDACPVAFVGGSLVPHGGQNPIEAVRHATVVLTGPHVHNFADAYRALLRNRGAFEVGAAAELAESATMLLSSDVELERSRKAAATALTELTGALEKTVAALLSLLPDGEGMRRAG